MATEILGTAFCDKNTWYAGNNPSYTPSQINDGSIGTRWIGTAVDTTLSLQNFCGIKFAADADVSEVLVNIASWGRSFRIGTWASAADPASASFTKADIIPIRSIDAFNDRDDDGAGIQVGAWLRFAAVKTKIPGILFYCDDNSFSSLTNTAGQSNTNESIYEVRVFGAASSGGGLVKQEGTAIASSQYNDFGLVGAVNDGNYATGWSGGGVGAGAVADWVALQFGSMQKVKKAEVYIYSWGKTIVLGYTNSVPTSKANFTVVRTIDVTVTPNDDLGVPWGRQKLNTILLPANNVGALIWGVYTNDSGANILGASGGALDRTRMMELNFYTDGVITPAPPADPHPKPPASVPSLPYIVAAPASWVKTEYATPGDFTFTPAVDTSVVLVVAQGAGCGGRANISIAGDPTPNDATLLGGDSFASNSAGRVILAPGGKGPALADVAQFPPTLGTPANWIRALDQNARIGGTSAPGNAVGTAGGQSFLQGVAGTAFNLAVQSTNGSVTANTVFTGATAIPFTPTFVNASRVSATGLTTSLTLATAGNPTVSASIEYTFKAYAGQSIGLSFGWAIPVLATTTGTVSVGGNIVYTMSATAGATTTQNFTVQADGNVTVRFDISTTATTGTIPYIRVTSMTLTGVGQGGATSGASGRAAALYMLPEPLTFTVGKGGIGQPGGQAITVNQNGTRGSGAGVGGNGGDGVITIYEWKGAPLYDKPPQPLFPTYNVTTPTEVLAAYRTNYIGVASASGLNTRTPFTHKLRPRTKYVLALITGAGGSSRGGSATVPSDQPPPTTITSGAITNVAESGWSGSWSGGSGNGGIGGNMQDAPNILFGSKGTDGYASFFNGTSPNTSVIAGSYGSGGTAQFQSASGGGCGGYALLVFPASAFSADRTITGLITNSNTSSFPGAVFLFETENDYGPFITGLVESLLLKNDIATTAITQTSEQFLLKQTSSGSNVSTTAQQVFYKESDSTNTLQVSHAAIAFVVDADDPATTVTSAVEQILLRDKQAPTAITSSVQSIFMRTGNLPWRITQTAQMIFAAELPSVFWLQFGTLQYPLAKTLYDSQVGRATSVQPGAYIQLESPHMDGTTLVVNGVAVGLSSPIANNDQVYIRGGVTNYYQKEMNVYTYYTKNGQIARELVGQWKLLRADLTPTISRKYSVPYTNATWIKTRTNYGIGNLIPLWTRAYTKLGAVLTAAMASGRSALAGLTSMFTKALTTVFSGNGAVISQNNHETFVGPDAEIAVAETVYATGPQSIITKAQEVLGLPIDGEGASSPHANAQAWDGYEQMIPGAEPVTMLDFEQSHVHTDQYENTDFIGDTQVGFGVWTAIDYLTGNPVGFGLVHKDYEYNAVGKSYSSEQAYTAVYNSGSGKPFSMTAFGTIAYSVLTGTSYTKNSGVGTGNWLMPLGVADWARNGFGLVTMVVMDRAIAHPHLADRTVERDGGHNQGYFDTSPIMHKVGFGSFVQSVIKTSVNSGTVERIVIHTQHYLAKANLTAYRPAEAISGRGKASLYMGFDTLQDVQDYTEQYAGVTTLAAYNGFVYNLAVDKSFVCEIYFNGAVSGLIQGG